MSEPPAQTSRAVSSFSHVTFELHTLGWKAFQDLCSMILSQLLGQTFQVFHPGHDGGRDGAFRGTWKQGADSLEGSFTAQCKFTGQAGKQLTLAVVAEEIKKAAELVAQGLAHNYLLLTNYSVTATTEQELRGSFTRAGIKEFRAFGAERICQWIAESPRLRQLVPRTYGLGDLSQILDERVLVQTDQLLASVREDLRKFVPTGAYRQAVEALNRHRFVLLLGEPACGKSAIASTLALVAPDSWNCIPLKVEGAREFKRHWNPHDPKRLFWIDDAFGATQYQSPWVHEWNANLSYVSAALRAGARVVITSRDYIYAQARRELKQSAFPLFQEAQVVVRVEQLTTRERQQILYNHVRLGDQPPRFRTALKPHLKEIARHPAFRPEIARRLGTSIFTGRLEISHRRLLDFVEHPTAFLREVLEGLDAHHRASLALLFMHGGRLARPVELVEVDTEALARFGADIGRALDSLDHLEGSLTRVERSGEQEYWAFRHPSIRDAFAEFLAARPDLLDVYLRGTPDGKLFQEISCGAVELEGVRLVVPASRFKEILARLEGLRAYSTGELSELTQPRAQYYGFLARRCSRQFLELAIGGRPALLDELAAPHSYLGALDETSLVKTLMDLGLFPEPWRGRWLARVIQLAVETPDADFLTTQAIRAALSEIELESIREAVQRQLIPKLARVVAEWDSHYPGDVDPDDYFWPLRQALLAFKAEWFDGQAEAQLIDEAVIDIDAAIQYRLESGEFVREGEPDYDDWGHRASTGAPGEGSRSIFDDVDE